MSYRQFEESIFICPKCEKEYSLNDNRIQYGFYSQGKLIKCSSCFERFKHEFWLRMIAEEEE